MDCLALCPRLAHHSTLTTALYTEYKAKLHVSDPHSSGDCMYKNFLDGIVHCSLRSRPSVTDGSIARSRKDACGRGCDLMQCAQF